MTKLFAENFHTFIPGIFLRILFYNLLDLNYIQNRPELSTPLTSKNYLNECISLSQNFVRTGENDPYQTDSCHELPLFVWMYSKFQSLCSDLGYFNIDPETSIFGCFLVIDLLTGLLLGFIGQSWSEKYNARIDAAAKSGEVAKKFLSPNFSPNFFTAIHAYNPMSILACLSLSTQVIYNFLICVFLYNLDAILSLSADPQLGFRDRLMNLTAAALSFAILSVGQFWFVQILAILLIFVSFAKNLASNVKISLILLILLCLLNTLAYYSANYELNPNAFNNILKFNLLAPDYTPNTGIWWYLIIEMFEHFRSLFLSILGINVFFYAIPLAIFYHNDINDLNLVMYEIISIICIFKSYTSLTDLIIPLILITCFYKNVEYRKTSFIAWIALFICVSLCPIMWSQWVVLGRGNANFFFAVTLGIVASMTLLVTDVLYGHEMLMYRVKNDTPEDTQLTFSELKYAASTTESKTKTE